MPKFQRQIPQNSDKLPYYKKKTHHFIVYNVKIYQSFKQDAHDKRIFLMNI